MRKMTKLAAVAALMSLAGGAFAAEVEVKMQIGKAKQVMAGLFDKRAAAKTAESKRESETRS